MFRGRLLTGQGNRITKRGSVLAEDARRDLGSNGRRHVHYYVPLDELRLAKPGSGPRHHSKRTPE
ncbi:hypothetical protein [Candidatus Palauibacter sp.]|uniref:hypothetical protein n=1 Tax=Candidatus Palauibacter sp. TaxID=3101350 RepID=UPI003B5A6BB4